MIQNNTPWLPHDIVRAIAALVPDIRAMSCVCKQWAQAAESLPDLPRWRLIVQGSTRSKFIKYGMVKMRKWVPADLPRAAKYGNLELVQHLTRRSNADRYLCRAIQCAAGNGHLAVVQCLVEAGAMRTHDANRALRFAAINNHLAVVRCLVGLVPNAHEIDSALKEAAGRGYLEIVRYLIEAGADMHADNDNALWRAGAGNHLAVVKYLVESGFNINADQCNILQLVAYTGHLEVVKYLVDAGMEASDGALLWAAEGGHLCVVRYLANCGANVHMCNDEPLHRAAENGHIEVVQYLVEAGACRRLQ